MKNITIFLIVSILSFPFIGNSQQFNRVDSIHLKGIHNIVASHWLDIDNDSIMEVIFQAQAEDSIYKIFLLNLKERSIDT